LTVLDAGDPVHGAKIAIAGAQTTSLTAPAGTVTATLPAGWYAAVATASGYTAAKASFTAS
jgi:hypothetical protein